MTDKEEQHSRSPRKHVHSNRARPGHSRIYPHLGVRDLREIIDRRRGVNEPVPPSDPPYNCLNDSVGETIEQGEELRQNARRPRVTNNRREKEHKSSPSHQLKDIENPLNIKVEFSTSTGEHSYQLDESTVLPTIKHVPDHPPGYNRPFRGRGRGRGRGRNYQTRTIRNKRQGPAPGGEPIVEITQSNDVEEDWDLEENERKEGDVQEEEEVQQNEVGLEQNVESLKLEDDKDKENKE